jgi:hypothetical protein
MVYIADYDSEQPVYGLVSVLVFVLVVVFVVDSNSMYDSHDTNFLHDFLGIYCNLCKAKVDNEVPVV